MTHTRKSNKIQQEYFEVWVAAEGLATLYPMGEVPYEMPYGFCCFFDNNYRWGSGLKWPEGLRKKVDKIPSLSVWKFPPGNWRMRANWLYNEMIEL